MMIEEPPPEAAGLTDELPAPSDRRPVGRALTLAASFRYAFAGLGYLLHSQRNAQIHVAIGLLATLLGLMLGFTRWEWAVLALTCALVLVAEGINTAVEAAVDLASPAYHPLAKVAKDVAAGTVLLSALFAVLIGCILFLPHLWPLLRRLLGLAFA
jgi:diacylglycerol kinase (ATP)